MRDGIHSIWDTISCAGANNTNEAPFDREVNDLWEGLIPEGKTILQYRKEYLAKKTLNGMKSTKNAKKIVPIDWRQM